MDIEKIKEQLAKGELFLVKDRLLTKEQHDAYQQHMLLSNQADEAQGVRKVLLNSSYGASLNEAFRFGDPRLGASTTFSGRQITSCMINTSAMCLDENPSTLQKHVKVEEKKKRSGETVRIVENEYTIKLNSLSGPIYSDTDSVYFSMNGLVDNVEDAVAFADSIADEINNAFPAFMRVAFNCQPGWDDKIKAVREIVARSGILQAKKKYMLALVDKEGKRVKPGDADELKTMGSDIRLSSTPEKIREFLKEVVMMILNEEAEADVAKVVIDFRKNLGAGEQLDPLELATVVSVNKLDEAQAMWNLIEKRGSGKAKIHTNARASINYNYMLEQLELHEEPVIKSGDKIKLLWLEANEFGYENIAFPSELEVLPEWFKEIFTVDMAAMETKLVDQKLKLIYDAIGWEVPTFQTMLTNSLIEF